jgi:uncharacterized protein YprB with RNaseH-like and TPR domain
MGDLNPIAFDIETSGLDDDAVITVAGFAHDIGESIILNTDGREIPDQQRLATALDKHSAGTVSLVVCANEAALLHEISEIASSQIDGDRHYLTAYNGETWNGGFDLPFCRTRFLTHDMEWPFRDLAYADMMETVDRFDTGDKRDLVGVYKQLISEESCDPFEDSEEAVETFEAAEWLPLLKHNLADIQRTRELALLAGRFVPKSDFSMKNLQPPHH